jgi:hypothetical protein
VRTHFAIASDLRTTLALALSLAIAALSTLSACDGSEAPRHPVPVVIAAPDPSTPVLTDLGYVVTLTAARARLSDLVFTTAGETHAHSLIDDLTHSLASLFIGRAHAHPGHAAGGEVLGELPGTHDLDLLADGAPLGLAMLLEGRYNGADFRFVNGDATSGFAMVLTGQAERDGQVTTFSAVLDLAEPGLVVGAPLDLDFDGTPVTLAFGLTLVDPLATGPVATLFDGVDFAALAVDGALVVEAGGSTHNRLRRAALSHDFYHVLPR